MELQLWKYEFGIHRFILVMHEDDHPEMRFRDFLHFHAELPDFSQWPAPLILEKLSKYIFTLNQPIIGKQS